MFDPRSAPNNDPTSVQITFCKDYQKADVVGVSLRGRLGVNTWRRFTPSDFDRGRLIGAHLLHRLPLCHLARVRPSRPNLNLSASAALADERQGSSDMDDGGVLRQGQRVEGDLGTPAAIQAAAVDHDARAALGLAVGDRWKRAVSAKAGHRTHSPLGCERRRDTVALWLIHRSLLAVASHEDTAAVLVYRNHRNRLAMYAAAWPRPAKRARPQDIADFN